MEQEPGQRGVFIALGAVTLGVLAIVGWSLLPSPTTDGPPPPTALPQSVLERAAPVVQKTAAVPTPEVPADMKARRDAREVTAAESPAPKGPVLRSTQNPVSPYDISRITRRTGDRSRAGPLTVEARFGGKPVAAHVVVDGVFRGDSPVNLELPPGEHVIRLDYAKAQVNEFSAIATRGYNIKLAVDLREPNQKGPTQLKRKLPKRWMRE